MTKHRIFALGFAAALIGFGANTLGQGNTVTVSGSGSGAFEDPIVAGGAVGFATCTLNRSVRQIDCNARIFNILDLRDAHMHVAGPGIAGPVILPIPNLPLRVSNDFAINWTWRETDLRPRAEQGIHSMDDALEACSSGNCYLNFHTTLNPGGELRINLCPESRARSTFTGVDVCHPDK